MPTTPNKGYEVQTTGTNTDTWGSVLNDDMISIVDRNLGGVVTKTLASSTVNLSATESQNLTVVLNGTLSANVLVTTLAVGMTIIENVTSGAFAVTFQLFGVGSAVTIPQGTRAVVITDSTNGARTAADSVTEFASGTRIVFNQTTAPTGWTKESSATYNAAALQFTTGSVGTGGSLAFGTAFTSRSITGTVGNTTLTVNQIPLHSHPFRIGPTNSSSLDLTGGIGLSDSNQSNVGPFTGTPSATQGEQIGGTGGSQSHNHTLSVNNLDISVKYASCIIAQKN